VSSDRGTPKEPDSTVSAEVGPLTEGPHLVKVDRYGSVSGLVRVRVPLGVIVIVPTKEVPYGRSCAAPDEDS